MQQNNTVENNVPGNMGFSGFPSGYQSNSVMAPHPSLFSTPRPPPTAGVSTPNGTLLNFKSPESSQSKISHFHSPSTHDYMPFSTNTSQVGLDPSQMSTPPSNRRTSSSEYSVLPDTPSTSRLTQRIHFETPSPFGMDKTPWRPQDSTVNSSTISQFSATGSLGTSLHPPLDTSTSQPMSMSNYSDSHVSSVARVLEFSDLELPPRISSPKRHLGMITTPETLMTSTPKRTKLNGFDHRTPSSEQLRPSLFNEADFSTSSGVPPHQRQLNATNLMSSPVSPMRIPRISINGGDNNNMNSFSFLDHQASTSLDSTLSLNNQNSPNSTSSSGLSSLTNTTNTNSNSSSPTSSISSTSLNTNSSGSDPLQSPKSLLGMFHHSDLLSPALNSNSTPSHNNNFMEQPNSRFDLSTSSSNNRSSNSSTIANHNHSAQFENSILSNHDLMDVSSSSIHSSAPNSSIHSINEGRYLADLNMQHHQQNHNMYMSPQQQPNSSSNGSPNFAVPTSRQQHNGQNKSQHGYHSTASSTYNAALTAAAMMEDETEPTVSIADIREEILLDTGKIASEIERMVDSAKDTAETIHRLKLELQLANTEVLLMNSSLLSDTSIQTLESLLANTYKANSI